jgi:hypothetical protein
MSALTFYFKVLQALEEVAALWETLVNRAENQVRGYQGT